MNTANLKEFAEYALDRGFRVFPLKPKSKLPATAHGFKDCSSLPGHIDEWWDQTPEANIGIACGESNLCVLDFDHQDDIPDWVKKIKTFKVKTARGLHVYFWGARPGAKMFNSSGKHIGEIKSTGGYVLGYGSAHPDGPIYSLVDDSPIAKAPAEIAQLEKASGKPPVSLTGDVIPYGSHDNYLHSLAGKLRYQGLEEEAIYSALVEVCEKRMPDRGSDYLEMSRKHARDICQKPVGQPTVFVENGQLPGTTATAAAFATSVSHSEGTPKKGEAVEITLETLNKNFPAYDGKPAKEPRMLIDSFLMGGVNFYGSLSGVGKTWFGLATAKALTTGEPLFRVFPVKQITPVLYLVPETDEEGFKYRLGVIAMPQNPDLFRYRTISQGETLSLTDPLTLAAIKFLHHDGKYPHVLVIVDTAVRFMLSGKDEKSATDNTLSHDADRLRAPDVGADLLFLHHSPKDSSKAEMSLENVLRGTGDFGAMADAVFGLRRDEALYDYGDGPEEIDVINVKTRSPEKPKPFRVRLKRCPGEGEGDRPISVIQELGTLEYIGEDEANRLVGDRLDKIIRNNQAVSIRSLKEELHMRYGKVKELAESLGWRLKPKMVPDPNTGKSAKKFLWTQVLTAVEEPDEVLAA